MKTKLGVILLLGLLTIVFLSGSSLIINNNYSVKTDISLKKSFIVFNNTSNRFLFGAMDTYRNGFDYDQYDSLAFNLWHTYTDERISHELGKQVPQGRITIADSLTADVSEYSSSLISKLNEVHGHNNSLVFWHRPKIEWLCAGQSSIYQAEPVTSGPLWFYSFNTVVGTPENDYSYNGGNPVLHCTGPSTGANANYVLKRLKANTEQCRNMNHWLGDNENEWYIKPRIRIDSNVAHDISNPVVCNIKVIGDDGSTQLLNVDIHANDFLVDGGGLYYNGRYIDDFDFPGNTELKVTGAWGSKWWYSARGTDADEYGFDNHADIQVYWYDNCDMWIDYVKVENDIADGLMNPNSPNFNTYNTWIEDEVNEIVEPTAPAVYKFYIEHFEFNNIPCIKYVNDRLKSHSGNTVDLIADFDDLTGGHLRWGQHASSHTADYIYANIIEKTGFTQFFFESYPLTSKYIHNISSGDQTHCRIPNTLPRHEGDSILAYDVSPNDYEEWLQEQLDADYNVTSNSADYPFTWPSPGNPNCGEGPLDRDEGNFSYYMKIANEMQREHGITFINMPQAHQWFRPIEVRREPTNEELDLLANLPVSYGAKGLMYFYFPSDNFAGGNCIYYSKGIVDNGIFRRQNVYSQAKYKWKALKDIGARMKKWEQHLMSFEDANTHSYIYYKEYSTCLSATYFYDIKTYPPDATLSQTASTTPDDADETYLQASVFTKAGQPKISYFMIVNRRCSPYDSVNNHDGGRRKVKVKFDNNTTWGTYELEDLYSGTKQKFNRNASPYVDLGWFMPAEGRLYKLSPVMVIGGELLTDEVITGESYICEDTVLNGGYNITYSGTGNTVQFSDSATIIMTGGTFKTSDSVTQSSNKNTFKAAVSGHTWGGLRFNGTNVKMYNSKFENISSPSVNYAVKMYNCPLGDIRNNVFTLNTDTAGAIQSVYSNSLFEVFYGFFANYNTITMNNSRGTGICVQGFSGLTIPIYAMNNTMTSNGYATGIMLSTVTGGGIKKNSITGFSTGINALETTADIFYNTITNSSAVSKGITAYSSSSINLAPVSGLWLGGFNTLNNTVGSSVNIEVDNSIFTLDGGKNTFDITDDADPEAQHLYGEFWEDSYPGNHTENCFKLRGTAITSPNLPYEYISDGSTQLSLTYISYLCGGSLPGNNAVADLGYGLYDTIPQNEGMGGGKGMAENRLPLSKGEKQRGSYSKTTPSFGHPSLPRRGLLVLSASQLYDSIRINIAMRNYGLAENHCMELTETYPESWQSIASLQTLFLCVSATDTTSAGITALKNHYEELILENDSNTALINIANYMVQKCKVLLHQYNSALSGFQSIINANQYSYLGLLARWDYMATSLLPPTGGGNSIEDLRFKIEELQSDESEEFEKFDKFGDDKFTKEQKQNIRTSVKTALENTSSANNDRVKKLEEQSSLGDVKAERELRTAKKMKEVIKTEKPKDITEHIRIVSSDAQKVFGNTEPVTGNKSSNIPTVFRLGQNYPNPFNPATKIAFDLPADGKVNLVIYDILGREVKRLVNNEVRTAGSYIVDFNASVYASGVYFYRLEVEELNGSKHVDSKKMVLVK